MDHSQILEQFLLRSALKSKTLFNQIHWQVFCEAESESNDAETRAYYKRIYAELLKAGEAEVPEIVKDITTSLELRRRVLELTKYIQSRTDVKVDGKTAILRE